MYKRAAILGVVSWFTALQPVASQDFEVVPLRKCNSPKADYAPTYDAVTSSVMFTSEQSGVAALYRARLDESTGIDRVAGTFNSQRHQRGCVSLDSNGNGVGVVYASYDDQMYAGLSTVTRQGADVNLGRAITTLNGAMYVSQPSISPDGSRLAFVSTREGGRGGLDLWVCERREDLSWSDPMNAGRNVNSDADEISPFFASVDTLLFASNGFGGKGGFDIMMSVLRDGVWHEPIPLEEINSEYDDSDCIILRNGTMIFASTRPGGQGGLDLWIATLRNRD